MASKEIKERRRLRAELDKLCVDMDLDALRFIVVVAALRTMTFKELVAFQEHVRSETQRREHEQHEARGPEKPR